MRTHSTIIALLVACCPLAGCGEIDRADVVEFVDRADEAARKRFAPEICELRGENFKLSRKFQGDPAQRSPATGIELDRKMFCAEAGKFSRLRQYKLERKSLLIELSKDRRSARVTAEYVETLPYYHPDAMPATPDDFYEWQIIESRDESIVGKEGGDLVFLSTDADSQQRLVPKAIIQLPFD